jgi:rod shape-determining protein MreC
MRRLTRRQRVSAIALAFVAAGFLALDLAGSGLRSAHDGVRGALGSLYRGTDAVLGPARQFLGGLPHAGSDQDRIDALRHEVAQLRGSLADAQADAATTAALHRLQLAAADGKYRILPARITALGPGQGFDWTVTLDVGTRSGVLAGQTVTDGAGLVGRILHADAWSSVVLLAADPGSGVGVRDTRTGQLGLAAGRGIDGFVFTPLDPAAELQVGDRLVTGPAGASSYVSGISVGEVTAVRTSRDGTTTATVRPTTSPTALDLVGVILTDGQEAASRPPVSGADGGQR